MADYQGLYTQIQRQIRDEYERLVEKARLELGIARSTLSATEERAKARTLDGIRARAELGKLRKDAQDKRWWLVSADEWRDSRCPASSGATRSTSRVA